VFVVIQDVHAAATTASAGTPHMSASIALQLVMVGVASFASTHIEVTTCVMASTCEALPCHRLGEDKSKQIDILVLHLLHAKHGKEHKLEIP
jgi:hypothetical protein